MEGLSEELLAFIVVLGAVALGYGKFVGPYQTEITEAFCKAGAVKSRFKPLVNFAVGILLGVGITTVAAFYLDNWGIVPLGVLAGIFASSEAAKKHDAAAVKEKIADEVVEQVTVTDVRSAVQSAPQRQQFFQRPSPHPR